VAGEAAPGEEWGDLAVEVRPGRRHGRAGRGYGDEQEKSKASAARQTSHAVHPGRRVVRSEDLIVAAPGVVVQRVVEERIEESGAFSTEKNAATRR
jgi:hypothetical protein